jgi:hypothetical protein
MDLRRRSEHATATVRATPRGARCAAAFVAIVAAFAGCLVEVAACGGTTGQNGAPPSQPDAGTDATMTVVPDGGGDDADESLDAEIYYTDRVLPDVGTPGEGGSGGDAGGQWPLCPPDIPAILVDAGVGIPIYDGGSFATYEVPAEYAAAGQVQADPGSACASQVYLGSSACDECLKELVGGSQGDPWFGAYGSAVLPPCSDLWEAGAASVGPGAGTSRHDLCQALFNCISTSGCWAQSPGTIGACLCKPGDAGACVANGGNGPCYAQELAALEVPPGTSYVSVVMQSTNVNTTVGHAGGGTNVLFNLIGGNCLSSCAPDAGDGGP